MFVDEDFLNYNGGIVRRNKTADFANHEISLVGWGFDETTNTEYWVGRNSWGSYWGENGFFRMEMHKNTLFIESECVYGVPTTNKYHHHEENKIEPIIELI